MTDQLTTAEIEELLRLAEKATPGPWAAWHQEPTGSNDWSDKAAIAGLPRTYVDRMEVCWKRDAAFIAASRNAVPLLAREVLRLRERVRELETRTQELD